MTQVASVANSLSCLVTMAEQFGNETFIIERLGKPFAVIIGFERYQHAYTEILQPPLVPPIDLKDMGTVSSNICYVKVPREREVGRFAVVPRYDILWSVSFTADVAEIQHMEDQRLAKALHFLRTAPHERVERDPALLQRLEETLERFEMLDRLEGKAGPSDLAAEHDRYLYGDVSGK